MFTDLTPETIYSVRVRAYNEANAWSEWSIGTFTTTTLTTFCGCMETGLVGEVQENGTCQTTEGQTIPSACTTCNNTYTEGQTCRTNDRCGVEVDGTRQCSPYGDWECIASSQTSCTTTDQCPNIDGIQLSKSECPSTTTCPDGTPVPASGTCGAGSCTLAAPGTSYCVQLFDENGTPQYNDAGVTDEEYEQYFKSQVESIYYVDGALVTDHTIYGIAKADANGATCNQSSVCRPGPLKKTGCSVNGTVASCYTEDSNETNYTLQVAIDASPDSIPQGDICTITWDTDDAQSCVLTQSGTQVSDATAGQRQYIMGDKTVTFNLTCTEKGTGKELTRIASCTTPGDFSER